MGSRPVAAVSNSVKYGPRPVAAELRSKACGRRTTVQVQVPAAVRTASKQRNGSLKFNKAIDKQVQAWFKKFATDLSTTTWQGVIAISFAGS